MDGKRKWRVVLAEYVPRRGWRPASTRLDIFDGENHSSNGEGMGSQAVANLHFPELMTAQSV